MYECPMVPLPTSDIFARRRLALTAVTAADIAWPDDAFTAFLRQTSGAEQENFAAYLATQGLAGHWLVRLRQNSAMEQSNLFTILQQREKPDAMCYLGQQRAIAIAEERFSKRGIPYAVMKGAHVRELLYPNPAIRPAVDVDILIARQDRFKAVEILAGAGFAAQVNPATVSHEVSLTDTISTIDLHWDVLRPGRVHASLAKGMLERRGRCQNFFALSPQDELFLLLFHPVFTKYLTAPHARLVGVADLFLWGKNLTIDWDKICRLCVRYRLTTAAWLVASYVRLLTDSHTFDDFITLMRPSAMKAAWLDRWLRQDYSSRFLRRPNFIKLLFTLPAHDRYGDALRFLISRWAEWQKIEAEYRYFKQVIEAAARNQ